MQVTNNVVGRLISRSKYEHIYEALSVLPLFNTHFVPFEAIPTKPSGYHGILYSFHRVFPVTIKYHKIRDGLLFVRIA